MYPASAHKENKYMHKNYFNPRHVYTGNPSIYWETDILHPTTICQKGCNEGKCEWQVLITMSSIQLYVFLKTKPLTFSCSSEQMMTEWWDSMSGAFALSCWTSNDSGNTLFLPSTTPTDITGAPWRNLISLANTQVTSFSLRFSPGTVIL